MNSNNSDLSPSSLNSSSQILSQIPRPTQIVSSTHDLINNISSNSSQLISTSSNSLNSPNAKNFFNSTFTSNFNLPDDGINEEDNYSTESGSGEGRTSVTSFASSNDKEDTNSKFSSPRILTPVSMSQLKLNKNENNIRRTRSPYIVSDSSSPVPELIQSSPTKNQLSLQNNSNILPNNLNNKYSIKQQLRSKSCSISKPPLIEQKSSIISGNLKSAIISTVFISFINNLKIYFLDNQIFSFFKSFN